MCSVPWRIQSNCTSLDPKWIWVIAGGGKKHLHERFIENPTNHIFQVSFQLVLSLFSGVNIKVYGKCTYLLIYCRGFSLDDTQTIALKKKKKRHLDLGLLRLDAKTDSLLLLSPPLYMWIPLKDVNFPLNLIPAECFVPSCRSFSPLADFCQGRAEAQRSCQCPLMFEGECLS